MLHSNTLLLIQGKAMTFLSHLILISIEVSKIRLSGRNLGYWHLSDFVHIISTLHNNKYIYDEIYTWKINDEGSNNRYRYI